MYLTDPAADVDLAQLFFPSSVHSMSGRDDATRIGPWTVRDQDEQSTFSVRASSSIWEAKTYRFVCAPDRFRYEVTVEGDGRIEETTFLGGYCSAQPRWGSGYFLSGHRFTRGFNPEPNAEDRWYFDPDGARTIDLTGGPMPGKRHWFFTPAPFCYALETGVGWMGIGLEAAPGAGRFTEFRYTGGGGFFLTVPYEGSVRVDGTLTLPALGFDFAPTEFDALSAHVAALRASGAAPLPQRQESSWWSRPIFCGWGAQCARAAALDGYRSTGDDAVDGPAFLLSMPRAPDGARQDVYEEFLETLDAHDVRPGTVTIDDKWQARYGENDVDTEKWPDLAGFIRACHERGQRVLLWLKAWDVEGVPDDECIRNREGTRLGVDPTHPAYERRLRSSVRRMLSAEGYGADGFKIDFTHRVPVGPGLISFGEERGLELMKRYLANIYTEAKAAKPDALIMTHTPHPYLADVVDMIRLNDMVDLSRLADPSVGSDIVRTVSMRARVARIAMPEALIDTDNWPVRNKAMWREYLRLQPLVGVPSLYFADRIDVTQERFDLNDYELIREIWNDSGRGIGVPSV